ncbi:RPL21 [Symbiodinium microadriaticum]|nr:RPL21 [Symbiodinium microadriaticum]
MPHSFGYRGRTRHLFKKDFKTKGRPNTTTFLRTFKRGDYVDIKVDSSVHKGMPFKYYHGRTGVVFNITKRAIGVDVKKEVNGRILNKRIHVAVPHVNHSKCRDEIIRRKRENEAAKDAVRKGGERVNLKRQPTQPKTAHFVAMNGEPQTIQATPYVDLV